MQPRGKDSVFTILRDINVSKAADINRLPERLLKDGIEVLADPVTDICKFSISLNKFPSAFKLGKVKPIFKKDQTTNASNYLPISLMQIFSKVIEKVAHEQIAKF